MQILEDLYLGDVRPSERSGNQNKQYKKALDTLVEIEETLNSTKSRRNSSSALQTPSVRSAY